MEKRFEDSEEFKQYLENLGAEYRFSCLHEKNAEGCHLLGSYFESVKLDLQKAAKLYKSNCDDYKYAESCYKYGAFNMLGRGCKENKETALEYYKKGCELNHIGSCLHSGLLLTSQETASSLKGSPAEGLSYLKKGCDADNQMSCFFASSLYISGAEGVSRDMVKAFELALKACELGNFYACANISTMYKKGEGVEKNEKLSMEYKKKAKSLKKDIDKGKTLTFEQHT